MYWRQILSNLDRYDIETSFDLLGQVLCEHFPSESRIRRRYEHWLQVAGEIDSGESDAARRNQIRTEIRKLAEQAHLL